MSPVLRQSRRRWLSSAAVLTTTVLALGACSSDSTSANESPTGAASASTSASSAGTATAPATGKGKKVKFDSSDACSALTQDQVTSIIPSASFPGDSSLSGCAWASTDGKQAIGITPLPSTDAYDSVVELGKTTGTAEPVGGLGDEAYLVTTPDVPVTQLLIKSGKQALTVIVTTTVDGSSTADVEGEKKVAGYLTG